MKVGLNYSIQFFLHQDDLINFSNKILLLFVSESVSMIVLLLKIITFLVAILFIARECYVWWNLSLCDMELCDSKYIDINIKLNTKSLRICYFLN